MHRLYYGCILLRDVFGYCFANKVIWPLLFIFALAFIGVLIGMAEVSAPYIYTLF